jgi:hypothetical protein
MSYLMRAGVYTEISSSLADQLRPSHMSPNAGGDCRVSANENCCAHHVTWSPNKLWRYNSIFNLWIWFCRQSRMSRILVKPVLRIRDILVRIRIPGSVPLTNGSGSCYFPSLIFKKPTKKKVFLLITF